MSVRDGVRGCSNLAGAVTVSPSNSSLEHDPAPSTASPSISEPLPTVGGGSHHARDAREMLRERRLVNWGLPWPALTRRCGFGNRRIGEPGSLRALEQRARIRGRPTSSPGGPRPVRVWRMPTMVSFTDVCGPIFAASRRADGRPRALQGGQYREGGIRTLVPGDPDNRFSRPAHDRENARGYWGFFAEGTKREQELILAAVWAVPVARGPAHLQTRPPFAAFEATLGFP